MLGHELRTPLNAIIGFSELMLKSVGELSDQHVGYAGDIHRSGRHLLRMITDVLNLTMLGTNALPLSAEPIDIARLLGRCERRLECAEAQRKMQLDINQIGAPRLVFGDPEIVEDILLRAIVAVTRDAPEEIVRVDLSGTPDGGLMVAVTGGAQDLESGTIDRTLKPFQADDALVAHDWGGNAIGLVLVQKLVELYDGSLLTSAPIDAGTTIAVAFPRTRVALVEPNQVAIG